MDEIRKIGVFTSARSEYGSFRGLIAAILDHPTLDLCLLVSGSHLLSEDGATIDEIRSDGFPIAAEIEMFDGDRTRQGFSKALGRELIGISSVLAEEKPDILLVNGDRAELLPLATAALALGIPMAHIAGGEITEGAIDDSVRHAITKLSHLHFPTNELHAKRIMQLGEEPWRVTVTGEPALDSLDELPRVSVSELEDFLGLPLKDPVVIVTYHPETLGDTGESHVEALIEVMRRIQATFVITYPNADPDSDVIRQKFQEFCEGDKAAVMVASLGQVRYYSMMSIAAAMLGNSSSGLWEAPSFELPVVNVGGRQDGRMRANNVIDAPDGVVLAIEEAVTKALSGAFKEGLKGMKNPYGSGGATDEILEVLASTQMGNRLIRKKFIDG